MTEPTPEDFANRNSKRLSVKAGETARFAALVWRRFDEEGGFRMAASLSYTSLLAIVPLTAIGFSMLAAFPVFEGIRYQFQDILFSNFLPQSADTLKDYFDRFVENAARLTAFGIVGLAVTAVLLLGTIEADLNAIFRVGRARALAPRLLVFWALITLGPLLLGASFSLSTYFFALTRWVGADAVSGSIAILSGIVPTVIMIVALTLCYWVVPNRRIRPQDAVLGGLVAGVLFSLLRAGFGFYVANFPTYQHVYGAVSAVPIFLIWMYLSWAVVLLGASLAAVSGEWRAGVREAPTPVDCGRRLAAALEVLSLLRQASRSGRGASRNDILKASGLDGARVDRLLQAFQRHGYADRTERHGWVPVGDLSGVTLYDFMLFLDVAVEPTNASPRLPAWRARLEEELAVMARAQKDAASTTLQDLLGGSDAAKDENPSPAIRRDAG
ncbi:MAG: YihY family inner membrane protein [Rhodospirillales bacterium]|nr:YihY family inner membrane protein [Rhodospirillales bacterium]